MKQIIFILFVFSNCIAQETSVYDLYILCKSKADIKTMTKLENDTIKYECYQVSWPRRCDYKKIGLRMNEENKLVSNIQIGAVGSSTIRIIYLDQNNNNPITKINSAELEQKSQLRVEDFPNYDLEDLHTVLSNAKNVFLLFEEKKNKRYSVRKVKADFLVEM